MLSTWEFQKLRGPNILQRAAPLLQGHPPKGPSICSNSRLERCTDSFGKLITSTTWGVKMHMLLEKYLNLLHLEVLGFRLQVLSTYPMGRLLPALLLISRTSGEAILRFPDFGRIRRAPASCGCFYKLGGYFVAVLIVRALYCFGSVLLLMIVIYTKMYLNLRIYSSIVYIG